MPEVQVSETFVETLPNSEQYPSNSFQYQCNNDVAEQQLTCELLDKDAGECSFSEEQELFLPQDNFTLILEGDEEAELGETTALPSFSVKSASPKSEGEHVNNTESNNQELIINSVSTVTSDQMSQNTDEVLPYVPEPIKMTIAENLLDIIKDTRNKEFSSEIVEESVQKSINKKLLSSPQDPIQNTPETNKEIKINQAENIVTSSTDTTGQTAVSLNDQLLPPQNKPDILVLPTPRRSTRGKDTSGILENRLHSSKRKPQEKQPAHALPFPVRGLENIEECDLEIPTDVHPVAQECQANISTRRGVKKSKELVSEFPKQPTSAIKSAPKNTRVGDQEGNQFIIDHTIQMTVNPKSARKLKTIAFKLAEDVISNQEAEIEEVKQSITRRRGRPRKHAIMELSAHRESEKLQLPSSVRRGRSRNASLLEAVCSESTQSSEPQLPTPTRQKRAQSASRAENVFGQETEVTEQQTVRRKRGRPRKNPLNVSADSELALSLLSPPLPPPQPNVKSFVTRQRNTRSAALNKSTTAVCLSSVPETALGTPRRSTRFTSANVEKTEVEKSVSEAPSDALAAARSAKRRPEMTAIKKKCKLSTLSEESPEVKPLSQATDTAEELQSPDVTKLRLSEKQKTVACHCSHVKRTRYSKKTVKQSLSFDGDEAFFFSPPLTKLTEKSKGRQNVF